MNILIIVRDKIAKTAQNVLTFQNLIEYPFLACNYQVKLFVTSLELLWFPFNSLVPVQHIEKPVLCVETHVFVLKIDVNRIKYREFEYFEKRLAGNNFIIGKKAEKVLF